MNESRYPEDPARDAERIRWNAALASEDPERIRNTRRDILAAITERTCLNE